MKQIVQSVSGGPVQVLEVPIPTISTTEVLVRTNSSIISSGTERAVTSLARANLLVKAKARPDLARKALTQIRTQGLSGVQAIRARLDDYLPLGYSACGVIEAVGEAVEHVRPGQRVATGGAGYANHAEMQAVPALLAIPVPDAVPTSDASFACVASVAMHAFRLAEVGPGSKVLVMGLGLIGQLAARIAIAAGCDVLSVDPNDFCSSLAHRAGIRAVHPSSATQPLIDDWARGRGADAVIIAAATRDSKLIRSMPQHCRQRAQIVVVGDVGLDLSRRDFYEKELGLRVARSYGPGRYDLSYEDWGVDYPAGYVRWTEGRNIESILDLLASDRLQVEDLVTHRFDADQGVAAYDLIESNREPYLAIEIIYQAAGPRFRDRHPMRKSRPQDQHDRAECSTARPSRRGNRELGLGVIGAGRYSRSVLVPGLRKAGFHQMICLASEGGLSARSLAEQLSFDRVASNAEEVICDPEVDVIVIATPHDNHASLATAALRARKHVFCEKPLALTLADLDTVEQAWKDSDRCLAIGFNRRFAPDIIRTRELFGTGGPLVTTYVVNAGEVPNGHWYHDRRQGGRILGEVCHFVDTVSAIVGQEPYDVSAIGASGGAYSNGNCAIGLVFPDGSTAAITYANLGHSSIPKEHITVLGRGHSAIVTDFRALEFDGKRARSKRQDKGHARLFATFYDAVTRDPAVLPTSKMIQSMRTTIMAAYDLGTAESGLLAK